MICCGDKLLLGCGAEVREGWVHHDRIAHSPHVDVAFDLEVVPWPLADESMECIEARHVVEHLSNTVRFVDECWRVLRPGGRLVVVVPHWQSENAWRDPTHLRAFHRDTFTYFDPDLFNGKHFGHLYTQYAWSVWKVVETGDEIVTVMEKRGGPWPR
jgi:SAM-dependent methyltransferase